MIKRFEDFNNLSLISERLHINKDIDSYSDKIYPFISNSKESYFEFIDLPPKLNISKLIIKVKNMGPGLSGQLDLNKSKQTKNGWVIYLDLIENFGLDTLKHELNHALRLTLVGKDKMIKNLNYIKSQNIFGLSKDNEMEYFFYLMYLANDEEINAKVMETNGFIKDAMDNWGVNKLDSKSFDYIIRGSDAFRQSREMTNFKCDDLFKNYEINKLNKLFYILEENKSELDRIQSGMFIKLKLIIKGFKDLLNNKTGFTQEDNKIYKPKRGKEFYDRWIPSQGLKLKKRIYSLFDHYK